MARATCRQCGWQLNVEADACPKCGTKPKLPHPWAAKICTAIFGVIVISSIFRIVSSTPSEPPPSTAVAASAQKADPSPQVLPLASKEKQTIDSTWVYERETDAMAKGEIHTAHVRSSNTHSFGFPYAGAQHGTLQLRTHPRYGRDIAFSIEKGQFLCRSYQECTILVRFDDGAPENFAGVGPTDSSTEHVFFKNHGRFLAKMKKAKRVRISTTVYRNGEPVFEFDVSGFDAAKLAQKT